MVTWVTRQTSFFTFYAEMVLMVVIITLSFGSSDLVNLPFWWRLRSALAVSTFPTSNTSSTTTCPAISKNTSTELEEPGVSEISVRSKF